MINARRDGIYMLLLGSVIFVALGFALSRSATAPMLDFRALYYPTRCLIEHCDPYNQSEVMRLYTHEGTYATLDTEKERQMATRLVYLPATLSATLPFAALPWGAAQILWTTLTGASLILASFLIWSFGADRAPVISGCLIAFLLANSELLIVQGMCAGIAISLCAIALWCFFRNRFVAAGICCLAIGLAIKPQDTGIVWLYLLFAGGVYRKHAIRTLLAWLAISLPAIVWVWLIAPNWIEELRSNVLAFSAHGGINDPSLASSGAHGLSRIISLQSVLSLIWDEPKFYNLVSLLLGASLLVIWAYVTMRGELSPQRKWFAIAAAAPLAMLPVYHRQYDAILILLTVPACALLFAEGGLIGRFALVVNAAGFVATGELPWVIFLVFVNKLHLQPADGSMLMIVLTGIEVLTTPLTILAMGLFYLWVFVRHREAASTAQPMDPLTQSE